MQSKEVEELATALERIAPSISVNDYPRTDEKGNFTKERVLCAILPPGLRFSANGFNRVFVPCFPGAINEEAAKRELLRQAGIGVTGSDGGHSKRKLYEATRYHKKINWGRLKHV